MANTEKLSGTDNVTFIQTDDSSAVKSQHLTIPKHEGNVKEAEGSKENVKVELENNEQTRFIYDVYESPPIPLTFGFAIQHGLLSLSASLSTSLLVADIVCARKDEAIKAKLLSTTMFMSGLCTFLQNTIGIRLPLYQGPTATFVVPLVALMSLPAWSCPVENVASGEIYYHKLFYLEGREEVGGERGIYILQRVLADTLFSSAVAMNITTGEDEAVTTVVKIQKLVGSLMIAGALQMLIGFLGLVGLLLRFIGPITVIPALTLMALYVFTSTVRFAKTQWGIAALTVGVTLVLSFYLGKKKTPIPWYSKSRGFHVKWSLFHKMFSILLATMVGWFVSWIVTTAGGYDESPTSLDYYARTDSRTYIIGETKWLIFPYPVTGQFGRPRYDTGALISFLIATLASIIDSIGDYYACVKVIEAPPPPKHAVSRGIAVEGLLSFIAGAAGAGHATSTFGGNIGAIGITKVASLRVFQLLGIIFMFLGIIGKIGAFLVTIPYPVIGGLQIISFGVLAGVMLSNLQFIDLNSRRNLSIIGISMLVAMMLQYWINNSKDAILTGSKDLDNTITMLMANPVFMAGLLACFFDNTMPGTREERGIVAWQDEFKAGVDESETPKCVSEDKRAKKLAKTIYVIPYFDKILKRFRGVGFLPVCPKYDPKFED
ncbi:solute carrier family 23 member 1-like [Mercenaria mercenaria]|uniref:solute carrier family 23 member 1-like n=1 Tax=Mercenaria mercenaria TaxID=6596 RepID=UPI00234F4A22|nr:solute carrier family 23 member 1-like [Mercenaria mercenaria]